MSHTDWYLIMDADADIRPELTCGICRMVLTDPVTHILCKQSFCLQCSTALMNTVSQQAKCPICRGFMEVGSLAPNQDLKEAVSRAKLKCHCGAVMPYCFYNQHHDQCQHIQGHIQTAFEQTKRSGNGTVNRWTFSCPDCEVKNLDRESLIRHVNAEHQELFGSCPICVAMPWGESDEDEGLTLAEHLEFRHRFDYDTFTVRTR